MITAISTPRVMAASAEPDRARYLARSRTTGRTAPGARRVSPANGARDSGARKMMATMRLTSPRTSSGAPPPLPPVLADAPRRKKAITTATKPGTTERCTALGGAGCPDRALTTGILVTARAGRDAAKYVAAMAKIIETMMMVQGKANAPMRGCELDSACGREASEAARPGRG